MQIVLLYINVSNIMHLFIYIYILLKISSDHKKRKNIIHILDEQGI
jgi:hypothetical protein